jgi:protein-histidine pros-kinase
MKILLKVNVVMVVVFLIGLAVSYQIADRLLQQNAQVEIEGNARIMMESALAVRTYTVKEIKPLLQTQIRYKFLPQTVSAYSAITYFAYLRQNQQYRDYSYKEATLNPTNPRDKADQWEADVVNDFRLNPEQKERIGTRDTPIGKTLYLARPLHVDNEGCLQCHSSVAVAPQTMIDLYGTANGFGWQLNDVIGAQIVSVPYDLPVKRANAALRSFVFLLVGLFLFLFVAMNILLASLVVQPVRKLAGIANEVSLGNMDAPAFTSHGKDEIAELGVAFHRLRRSLEICMEQQ